MADNLDLPQVAANQNQKEVTINDMGVQLSGALTDFITVDLSAGDDTVADADFQANMAFATSGNAVSRTLTFPAIKRALFIVQNGGSTTLNIAVGSTVLTLASGKIGFFQTDGTTNGLVAITAGLAASTVAQELDFCIPYIGKPIDGALLYLPFNQSVRLVTSLTGSNFFIGTNPTADMTFALSKVVAGVPSSIGSVKFAASTGAVTVTFVGDVDFAIGDAFLITAPSPQDATGADLSLNFKGKKL